MTKAARLLRDKRDQLKALSRERLDILAGTFDPTGLVSCRGAGSDGHPERECELCGVRYDRLAQAAPVARMIRQLENELAPAPAQMVLW